LLIAAQVEMMVREDAPVGQTDPKTALARGAIDQLRRKDPSMTALLFSSCLLLGWPAQQAKASDPPEPSAAAIVASVEKLISDAIATAEPSVVAIHRNKNETGQETLAIRGRKRGRSLPMAFPNRIPQPLDTSNMISFDFGSGVVIGDHGEILTLFHVVRGARELLVRAPGKQEFEAEIIAADPRSDLAVIVPVLSEGTPLPRLKPVVLGDPTRLRKGAFLVALGNSFNAAHDGNASASWGILSNISRKLELERDEYSMGPPRTLGLVHYPTLLQLDSKLNLGMSGGAVINLKGELVGLSTMASSPSGFDALAGYAIPMDKIIRRAIATLKEGKEVEYGLLGIRADRKFTNYVFEVQPGSPADRGQLQVNDQIVAVNGIPVTDFESLILAVNVFPAGEAVRLQLIRADEKLERTIVLAKLSVDGEVIATNRPKTWRGLRVEHSSTLYKTFMQRFGEPPPVGVVVVDIEDGSAGADSGLKRGQLIRKVGGKDVRSPQEFADAVASQEGPVTLDTDLGQVTVK
jgi:S1-C subfamily serine protease